MCRRSSVARPAYECLNSERDYKMEQQLIGRTAERELVAEGRAPTCHVIIHVQQALLVLILLPTYDQ